MNFHRETVQQNLIEVTVFSYKYKPLQKYVIRVKQTAKHFEHHT